MARFSAPGHNNGPAALLTFVERIERLIEEKKAIVDDIKSIKQEAASAGFAVKAVERIIKDRAETPAQKFMRREIEELTDVYRAALGMLDGTPLGDAARERLAKKPPKDPAGESPKDGDAAPPEPEAEAENPAATIGPEQIAGARSDGRSAQRGGKRVTDNPYVAGDPRRAAWDEGWCAEAGSDGMEIPEAWRRSEKKKDKKGERP